MLGQLAEGFKPEAVFGKASRRGPYIVVNLKSAADISEVMYALIWGTGGEPKFTPFVTEGFDEIIGKAKSLVFTKGLRSFVPGTCVARNFAGPRLVYRLLGRARSEGGKGAAG